MSIQFTIVGYDKSTGEFAIDHDFSPFDIAALRQIFQIEEEEEEFMGVFLITDREKRLIINRFNITFNPDLHYECGLTNSSSDSVKITTLPNPKPGQGFYPPPKHLPAFPDAKPIASYLE
jgi:hypothetical protein